MIKYQTSRRGGLKISYVHLLICILHKEQMELFT